MEIQATIALLGDPAYVPQLRVNPNYEVTVPNEDVGGREKFVPRKSTRKRMPRKLFVPI